MNIIKMIYGIVFITAGHSADVTQLSLQSQQDADRRHNERMTLQREFIDVLRQTLKKV